MIQLPLSRPRPLRRSASPAGRARRAAHCGPHRQRAAAARAPARPHPRPQRQPLQHPCLRRAARRARRHAPRDQPRRRRHLSRPRSAHRLPHLRSAQPAQSPTGGRLGPVDFVRLMEEALIRLCGGFGVQAGRICGLTGVWCGLAPAQLHRRKPAVRGRPQGERKIAAIGIHVARGVTSHGFAFNVTTDLRDFALINPCGLTGRPVTSLEDEMPGKSPSREPAQPRIHRASGGRAVWPHLQPADSGCRKPRRAPCPGASLRGKRARTFCPRRSRSRSSRPRIPGRRYATPDSSRDRAPAPHQGPAHSRLSPARLCGSTPTAAPHPRFIIRQD